MIQNIIIQIILGFSGMIIAILFMVQDYIADSVFDKETFLRKHKSVIIITSILLVMLAIIINLVPEAGATLKAITTMDITTEPHSFLFLATAIYATVYSKSRANQRSKERKE